MTHSMTYEQISNVLDKVNQYHDTVKKYLQDSNFTFADQQRQLLLATLENDQLRIQRAQQFYKSQKIENGNTDAEPWIQYVPLQETSDCVDRLTSLKSPDLEELSAEIATFHGNLNEFFQRMEEQAPSEESRRVLNDLAMLEEQNAKAISNRLNGLDDV